MKKAVLILFVCGLSFLIAGSALAIGNILHSWVIHSTGRIVSPDESSSHAVQAPPLPHTSAQSTQTNPDKVGYLTILASIGFFTAGLVIHRKRSLS